MKDAIQYIAHKRLELVLLVILATLLYVLQVPLPAALPILAISAGFLAIYEYGPVRDFPFQVVAMVRRYTLEIAVFCILVLLQGFWQISIEPASAILFAYFAVAITLNSKFVRAGLLRGLTDVARDGATLTFLVILFALMLIWRFSPGSMFFFLTFAAFVLYQWDSRIVAAGALLSLAACPILLIGGESAFAEQMAVYAYYFLIMTAALQILEYTREGESVGGTTGAVDAAHAPGDAVQRRRILVQ